MQRIVCNNCGKENLISEEDYSITECAYCFEPIQITNDVDNSFSSNDPPSRLTLICQETNESIAIPVMGKAILGREGLGAEVFNKILSEGKPVISRKHFSIVFRDGSYYIKDEGSKNGTFYGHAKLSCKDEQKIEDNTILFVGEEVFIVQISYTIPSKDKISASNLKAEEVKPNGYRCNETGCGYETKDFVAVCPKCSTYNSLIAIY
jgi:hypothetical protein